MAIAITQTKNFVGGEWLDAVEGGTMEVHNPATGDVIAEVPSGSAEDVERAVAGRQSSSPRVARDDAGRALGAAAEARRPHRGACRGARPARVDEHGQADRGRACRAARHGRQPALLRRRGPLPRGQGDGRVHARLHVDGPARADRDRRAQIAPWNYPLMMAIWKIGPALATGNAVDPQAGRADAAHHASSGRAGERDLPGRRPQRHHG